MARNHRTSKRKHTKPRSIPMSGVMPGMSTSDKITCYAAPGVPMSASKGVVRWGKL